MRPFMADGSYVNYLEDEGDPLARAAYGPNYHRLVVLKNKYDQTNFLRMNHNIKPTDSGATKTAEQRRCEASNLGRCVPS